MARHAPIDDVAKCVQIRAAVVVDDALRIARRSRRVIERDRVPLVGGRLPRKFGIALRDELLVVDRREPLAARTHGIDDIDDDWLAFELGERFFDRRRELGVGDQQLRLAMLEHERDRVGVEARVERVQHGARHRHAEMAFEHFRRVGQHHGDGIVLADFGARERGGELPRAGVGFAPAVAPLAVHDRDPVRPRVRRARNQRKRRQWRVVRGMTAEVAIVDRWSRHGLTRSEWTTMLTKRPRACLDPGREIAAVPVAELARCCRFR